MFSGYPEKGAIATIYKKQNTNENKNKKKNKLQREKAGLRQAEIKIVSKISLGPSQIHKVQSVRKRPSPSYSFISGVLNVSKTFESHFNMQTDKLWKGRQT